ncbi:MAG: NmrA/HSCARG family protein [candidate division KSB1 bacterium]|nr:NmrA/HSCARG family protein [candidate division KSB1 bacterium]MDQ7065984.1 NmrA/HSCARG family protein [candidate division KSB1 bacterium]
MVQDDKSIRTPISKEESFHNPTEAKPIALVIGVTGKQGGATTRHLKASGWRVRGFTRNLKTKRARTLQAQGIELIQGDLEDRAALISAMTGVNGVYGVTPMDPRTYSAERELRQGTLLAEAASEVGVPHLVFSSVAGSQDNTGVPHIDVKGKIEDRIGELGLRATILKPNIFMENLVDPGVAPVFWHLAPKLIGWQKPLPWVATEDIGAVAAQAFQNPERWAGRTLEIVGERRSLGEARSIYRSIHGRAPFRLPMPLWAFKRLVGKELAIMWQWQATADFGHHSPELEEMNITFMDFNRFFRSRMPQS